MTPHINAKKEDIAKVVIMPGDPLRAKWIAENFLENYKEVNSVRGMLAYTGNYKGKKISIMGHGMGIPSIGIYSYELYKFYDVDFIIRVGSAGSYINEIKLGDVLLVEDAFSNSTYAQIMGLDVNNVIVADKDMLDLAISVSEREKIDVKKVKCNSADVFYNPNSLEKIKELTKCDVVEMEAFGLFTNSIILNKKSLVLLTCSDSLIAHEEMSSEERQKGFKQMARLGLEIGISFYEK